MVAFNHPDYDEETRDLVCNAALQLEPAVAVVETHLRNDDLTETRIGEVTRDALLILAVQQWQVLTGVTVEEDPRVMIVFNQLREVLAVIPWEE